MAFGRRNGYVSKTVPPNSAGHCSAGMASIPPAAGPKIIDAANAPRTSPTPRGWCRSEHTSVTDVLAPTTMPFVRPSASRHPMAVYTSEASPKRTLNRPTLHRPTKITGLRPTWSTSRPSGYDAAVRPSMNAAVTKPL